MNLVFVGFFSLFGVISCASPTIHISQGDVLGTTYTLKSGREVFAFLGIPYAVPPTDPEKRFEATEAKQWAGTWDATTLPPSCLQYSEQTDSVEGDEDCLYLNIYTPNYQNDYGTSPLLDVLVYIHDGSFTTGNGNGARPDYILKNFDVIFVTFNYRLGALGFLSTGTQNILGNAGLKDQALALQWVHNNIRVFGGNPGSVTILGCGASVHYHMVARVSDGLFQRAISIGGSALTPWAHPRNNTPIGNIENSMKLGKFVGCSNVRGDSLVDCLRKRPSKRLVYAQKYLVTWKESPVTPFGPVTEPKSILWELNFVNKDPVQYMAEKRMQPVPWLVSFAKDEGLYPAREFITNETLLKELDERWNEIAPNLFMYNYSVSSEKEKSEASQSIRQFYFGSKPISKNTVPELIKALNDRLYYNDIVSAMRLYAIMINTSNVYCYKFSYRGNYSTAPVFAQSDANNVTNHADDLLYLLKRSEDDVYGDVNDAFIGDMLTSILIQFMKTGSMQNNGYVEWDPIRQTDVTSKVRCMEIASARRTPEMVEVEHLKALDFWEKLLPMDYNFWKTLDFSNLPRWIHGPL